mmetsp:Transcript_8567/g.18940  ORF Transcript_8567/g.18940 Transcript_8567/m.18940 type:complete len:355 (-) Transcript_8567:7-1071(-)
MSYPLVLCTPVERICIRHIHLVPPNIRLRVIQVARVVWREDERTLRAGDLKEEVVVLVEVKPVLHQLPSNPHVDHREFRRRQRRGEAYVREQLGKLEKVELRQVDGELGRRGEAVEQRQVVLEEHAVQRGLDERVVLHVERGVDGVRHREHLQRPVAHRAQQLRVRPLARLPAVGGVAQLGGASAQQRVGARRHRLIHRHRGAARRLLEDGGVGGGGGRLFADRRRVGVEPRLDRARLLQLALVGGGGTRERVGGGLWVGVLQRTAKPSVSRGGVWDQLQCVAVRLRRLGHLTGALERVAQPNVVGGVGGVECDRVLEASRCLRMSSRRATMRTKPSARGCGNGVGEGNEAGGG